MARLATTKLKTLNSSRLSCSFSKLHRKLPRKLVEFQTGLNSVVVDILPSRAVII